MNAWIGLLKKEFRLTRTPVIAGLILVLGYLFYIYFFFMPKVTELDPRVSSIPLLFLIFLHVFYLAPYMLLSLHTEARGLHLWLHNPQPAISLLSAKILSGLLSLIVSLLLTVLFSFFILGQYGAFTDLNFNNLVGPFLLVIITIIGLALNQALWLILAWTLYQIAKPYIGKLSWFVVITIILIPTWGLGKLLESGLYQLLTGWGRIELDFSSLLVAEAGFEIAQTATHINIGAYFFSLVTMLAVLFLSSWLLDNKVEV